MLRIPTGASARDWERISREWVEQTGHRPPPGSRVVHGCILPETGNPAPEEPASQGDRPPALVLCGMHRSGTSLFGQYFMASGIHLGETLIGPLPSNPYGHFEDLAFVELHERVLQRRAAKAKFTAEDHAEAARLINLRRSAGQAWGWKDPRTSFFLSEWAGLLPEAFFILVFRDPLLVVDSMCRRKEQDLNTQAANRGALGSWIGHNRALLQFHRSHPGRSLLLSVDRAVSAPERTASALQRSCRWPFQAELFRACYDHRILQKKPLATRPLPLRLLLQARLLHQVLLRASGV